MYIGVIYARACVYAWASDLFHARLVYFRSEGLSLRGGAVYRERDIKSIVDEINGQGACFLASFSSLKLIGTAKCFSRFNIILQFVSRGTISKKIRLVITTNRISNKDYLNLNETNNNYYDFIISVC